MIHLAGYRDSYGRDIMIRVGGYEYIGGCSVHWGFQYKSKGCINFHPHMNHDPPDILMTHG